MFNETEPTNMDLYDDQKVAMQAISDFLNSKDSKVFVLNGTLNSGKSFLIPHIKILAQTLDIPAKCFATSARIANNISSRDSIQVDSIYSYIYGGLATSIDDYESDNEQFSKSNKTNSSLKRISLKKSDNEENNALFIVDEAHLLSDTYYHSIDLVFGSGHLLGDFLNFADLQNTERKIIFIGDQFQMPIASGKKNESPMETDYLSSQYGITSDSFVLLDKPEYSELTHETLKCVNAMKNGLFNNLMFNFGSTLSAVRKDEIQEHIKIMLEAPIKSHVLTFSNKDSNRINIWIKQKILCNGEDIAHNDLVVFHNNINSDTNIEDSFENPKNIFNGDFATVVEISDQVITEKISIKQSQNPIILHFRRLKLKLNTTQAVIEVRSLEDFRNNEKAELPDELQIAYIVLLKNILKKHIEQKPFHKSAYFKQLQNTHEYIQLISKQKELQAILDIQEGSAKKNLKEVCKKIDSNKKQQTQNQLSLYESEFNEENDKLKNKKIKLAELINVESKIDEHKKKYETSLELELLNNPKSEYYQYKNAALLRYGWAMTVHRATAYKFDQIMINMDQGSNRPKTNYPYYQWLYTAMSRSNGSVKLINYEPISPFSKSEIKETPSGVKSKNVFFYSSENDIQKRLRGFQEFFADFITPHKLITEKIESFNYRERYYLKHHSGASAIVDVVYDGSGNFKSPAIIKAEPNSLKLEIAQIFSSKTSMINFSFTSNKWREAPYKALANKLNTENIIINAVVQNKDHDTLKINQNEKELKVNFWYGHNGFFSKIIPVYYSSVTLWDSFKNAIQLLGGDRGHQ